MGAREAKYLCHADKIDTLLGLKRPSPMLSPALAGLGLSPGPCGGLF